PPLEPEYAGEPLYVLSQAELASVDTAVEALYQDMRIALQIARHLPQRTPEVVETLSAAAEAFDSALDAAPADSAGAANAARAARSVLAPVLARPTRSAHTVTAVGHAHIDSAWLWPVRETKRKCARSFANQVALLDRYPEHRFACSQAAQYQWIKEAYPA